MNGAEPILEYMKRRHIDSDFLKHEGLPVESEADALNRIDTCGRGKKYENCCGARA
jgi:uncharacterized protein YchJ